MDSAVERIVEKILSDAKAQAALYEREADRKIDEIREEEYSRWEKEKARLEAEFDREAEDIKIQILSRAHMDGKRQVTRAREDVINRVLGEIHAGIRGSEYYEKYVRAGIEEAKSILGSNFVIKCIPEDKDMVSSIVSELSLDARVETDMIKNGGVVIESEDGSRVIDYSVNALIVRKMQDIRKMILDKLFEGEYA